MSALYALRFFASISIFLHHLHYPTGIATICVTFFFIVSGFTTSYSMNKKDFKFNKKSLKQFYYDKWVKIYPLYLLTLIVSVPVMNYTGFKYNLGNVITHLLMLQSYYPNGNVVFMFNSLSWFLSDIMLFYLISPFVFCLVKKMNVQKNNKFIAFIALLLFAIAFIISYCLKQEMTPYSITWWFVYISPYFRMFDFLIGFMIGLLFANIKDKVSYIKDHYIIFSILEILSLLLLYFIHKSPFLQIGSLRYGVFYIPLLVLIIFIFAFSKGFVSKVLSVNLFIYLGKLSSTIYITHQLIISYILFLYGIPMYNAEKTIINNLKPTVFLFFIVLCISDVIYRYFIPTTSKLLTTKFNLKKSDKQKLVRGSH